MASTLANTPKATQVVLYAAHPWSLVEPRSQMLCLLVATLFFAGEAEAAEPGVYVEARIGLASAGGASVSQPASVSFDVNSDSGAAYAGTLGYRFEGPVRVELDLTQQRNAFKGTYEEKIQILIFPPCGLANRPCLGRNITGRIKAPSAMIMAFYDWELAERWRLSLGVGIGAVDFGVRVDTRASFLDGTSRPFTIVDAEDTLVGGRAALQLSHDIGPVALVARYAYTKTESTAITGSGNLAFRYNQKMSGHAVTAGVKYGF